MVATQHALGSVSGNVGGNVNGDITSWEKNNTKKTPVYLRWLWMAEKNLPSQSDTINEKSASCDMQNSKTNTIKQLNGTNKMLFLYQIKAGWDMGFVT